MEYSKKEKKLLRNLVNIAYERELSSELNKLELSFSKFKNKDINAFELDNIIHKYHNETSRELYKKFNHELIDMTVAYSLKNGYIEKEEFDECLLEKIEDIIKAFYN